MKVLFAVSNEEISESIVKKYQKEYKEIISYKNVYYFNAILKELQKDKTYDRVVISEDLETFTSTQYDQIDKFIFEKLDSISDEASNTRGNDIPIILICSDRRTKSEPILVKLFGIGVYDAIIGKDRSIDEVCKLINKPRSKKEAKIYYKIDSEDVGYQSENENDVSEMEIQNIVAHYARLGKNEDKYIDSFNNIAAQYNDTQLRIITKFLPLNVRAVLEEKSSKYQQVMSFNNSVSDSLRYDKKKEEKTGPSEKLLTQGTKERTITEPIVIPSSVNMKEGRKLSRIRTSVSKMNGDVAQNNMPNTASQSSMPNSVQNGIPQSNVSNNVQNGAQQNNMTNNTLQSSTPIQEQQDMLPGFEEFTNVQENVAQQSSMQPSNAQQNSTQESITQQSSIQPNNTQGSVAQQSSVQQNSTQESVAQPSNVQPNNTQENATQEEPVVPVKRGRGRPRKNPLPDENAEPKVKRKRGRPRKNPLPEDQETQNAEPAETILPGLNQGNNNIQSNDPFGDILPGLETNNQEENKEDIFLPGFEEETTDNLSNIEEPEDTFLPGFEDIEEDEDSTNSNLFEGELTSSDLAQAPQVDTSNTAYNQDYYNYNNSYNSGYNSDNYQSNDNKPSSIEYQNTIDLSSLLTVDKRIAAFVGTSKNGTSFILNNVAEYMSTVMGVKTAILDTTKNRNSYYIYTKNEEQLRNIAAHSIEGLTQGIAQGINVNKNLTVYTALPDEDESIYQVDEILETLLKNYSVVLIDTDFETSIGYFKQAQEIYLVQSLDILTIQPLTAFLRELKAKNALDEQKLRIILNKVVKIKGITEKTIIGGMAYYNDPAMSFMTELFDRNSIKYISVPFEEATYTRYLQGVIECEINLKGYSKNFIETLKGIATTVYSVKTGNNAQSGGNFSTNMNNTLEQMRRKY